MSKQQRQAAKFSIYTTIDGLGGAAIGSGWEHGRMINGSWKPIEYASRETVLKALRGPQFSGRGAYATNGDSVVHAENV